MSTSQPTPELEQQQDAKPVMLRKTRKVFRVILAIDSWKRNANIVKKRATFPLLRSIFRTEVQKNRNPKTSLTNVPESLIHQSMLWHRVLAFALSIGVILSSIALVRGLTALLIFHQVTTWLIYSVPLLVFFVSKLIISIYSIKGLKRELVMRNGAIA